MASETQKSGTNLDRETAYIILAVGAIVGVALIVWPAIPFKWWWEPLLQWLREGSDESAWRPGVVLLSMLAGLALMFASFQYVRPLERIDPTIRVVLYGYNAGLTGVLLFVLLGIVNLFVNIFTQNFLDTTQGSFHSLSEVTRKYIRELDKPVKVYMVMSRNDPAFSNMDALLSNMKELNPDKFDFEVISPIRNDTRMNDMLQMFPQLTSTGLIVTYGSDKNYSLIPTNELTTLDFNMQSAEQERRLFNGEVRLMQELYFLAEEKRKAVIYFTQGHGEPEVDGRSADGISALTQRLRKDNYDVRPLSFKVGPDGQASDVPADADLVVCLGATRPMKLAVDALEKYMDRTDANGKKGKLLVFIGPTPPDENANNTMRQTGLEALLQKFNVELTNERILTLAHPQDLARLNAGPELVPVMPTEAAASEGHPLALNFKNRLFAWYHAREVRPGTRKPTWRTTTVIATVGLQWKETNMTKRPGDTIREFQANPKAHAGRITDDPLGILVTVAEASSDPHAFAHGSRASTPRMAVFGTYDFTTNSSLTETNYSLVRGAIDWNRERFTNIGIQPKSHKNYTLPDKLSLGKLFALPAAAMIFGILGMGAIVWTIRRR